MHDLNLSGGEKIVLRIATLPKATKLVLQPMTADFVDIADHRAVLERILVNQYTSLSAGELLQVHDSGTDYNLIVQDVEPKTAPAVSIINTDCNVEFAEALNAGVADGRQATRYLRPSLPADSSGQAAAGTATSQSASQSCLNGQLPVHGACDAFRIPLPAAACAAVPTAEQITQHHGSGLKASNARQEFTWGMQFTLDVQEGDADLYVSALPVAKPGPADALAWSSVPGSATLTVSPLDNFVSVPEDSPVAAVLQSAGGAGGRGGGVDVPPPPVPLKRAHSSRGAALTVKTLRWDSSTTLTACVRAYAAPVVYSLQCELVPVAIAVGSASEAAQASSALGTAASETGQTPQALEAGMAKCSVCGKAVPEMSLARHEAFCARNNWTCSVSGCGAVFKKGSPEAEAHWHCPVCGKLMDKAHQAKHDAQEHSDLDCSCGFTGHLRALREHKAHECADRYIQCRFCHTAVRAGERPTDPSDLLDGYTGHESYCGSRTTRCGVCHKSVMLKHLAAHAATYHPEAHFDDVAATPPPSPTPPVGSGRALPSAGAAAAANSELQGGEEAWTAEDARRLREVEREEATHCCNAVCALQAASSDVDAAAAEGHLCSRCHRLLVGGDMASSAEQTGGAVSQQQALVSALMKLYHGQLTAGCRKSGCGNPACVTGCGSVQPLAPGPAAIAALELCKLFSRAREHKRAFVCVTTSRVLPGVAKALTTGVPVVDAMRSTHRSDKHTEDSVASAPVAAGVSAEADESGRQGPLSVETAGRRGKAARKKGNKGSVASAFFG